VDENANYPKSDNVNLWERTRGGAEERSDEYGEVKAAKTESGVGVGGFSVEAKGAIAELDVL